jgi:hypothetical protein
MLRYDSPSKNEPAAPWLGISRILKSWIMHCGGRGRDCGGRGRDAAVGTSHVAQITATAMSVAAPLSRHSWRTSASFTLRGSTTTPRHSYPQQI